MGSSVWNHGDVPVTTHALARKVGTTNMTTTTSTETLSELTERDYHILLDFVISLRDKGIDLDTLDPDDLKAHLVAHLDDAATVMGTGEPR